MKDANQQKIAKKMKRFFFLFLKSFQKISSKFPILFRIRKRKQKLHIFIKSTFFYFLVGCCLFDNFFYFLVSLFLVMACFYAFAIFGSFFSVVARIIYFANIFVYCICGFFILSLSHWFILVCIDNDSCFRVFLYFGNSFFFPFLILLFLKAL